MSTKLMVHEIVKKIIKKIVHNYSQLIHLLIIVYTCIYLIKFYIFKGFWQLRTTNKHIGQRTTRLLTSSAIPY